jgi:DNA invertase Pin-like site-specific DNA recombinase
MEVALYARVSTSQQQHEGTIESQRRALKHHIQHHGWALLPEHEYNEASPQQAAGYHKEGHCL